MKNKSYNIRMLWFNIFFVIYTFLSLSFVQAEDWVYTVKKGDNLWNITVDYLIDISYVKQVQQLNNISDPWHLIPGTKINIPSEWGRHSPALVRVQNLQGTAQLQEDYGEKPLSLKIGDIAILGNIITTNADSSLILGFLDGSRILLQENSQLRIDHLMLLENTGMSDSRLHLLKGRLETLVTPKTGNARKFQITTPATVTSVRGTDYRISAEEKNNQSKTEVIGGKVIVTGGDGKRVVTAGYGTITVKGHKPLPTVKLLVAPDINQIPVSFDSVPIQFSMPKPGAVAGYRLQVAKTKLFRDILFDKPSNSAIIRGPDLVDGDYYLRIRAIDTQKIEGYNSQRLITINARPEAPFQISPKVGEGILLQDKLTFVWARQQTANEYHLQVAKTDDFSELLIDTLNIEDVSFNTTEKMNQGMFFWRIAATDQEGDGPFSDAQMFRRIVPAPTLEAPDITEDKLTIRSRKGLEGQSYHFQMSGDENFEELILDKYTEEPGFEIARPSGGEYFIRVRTIDSDGFIGPFASPQSIDVPYSRAWLLGLLPLLILLIL